MKLLSNSPAAVALWDWFVDVVKAPFAIVKPIATVVGFLMLMVVVTGGIYLFFHWLGQFGFVTGLLILALICLPSIDRSR